MPTQQVDRPAKQGSFTIASELTGMPPNPSLSEQVEQAMHHYFSQLGEATPANLYQLVLAEVEAPLLKSLLRHTRFNRLQAAKQLGISRTTLHKKLQQYGLNTWIQANKYRNVTAATEHVLTTVNTSNSEEVG